MLKKQLENMIEPSVIQRVNELNEISKQTDPLYQIRNSLEIMKKNSHLNSAISIGEIARKAFQQADLDFASFENQNAIARFTQSRAEGTVAFQDTFLELRKGLSAYNNAMSVRDRVIQSMGGMNVHTDIIASVNLARNSVKSYRSTFDTAHSVFRTSEISRFVRDIQSQKAITNSILSDYAGVFKQVESLRNLESFQSIFRLNDFQFEEVISTSLTQEDLTSFSEKPISEIESDLSDEIKSGNDFSLYSDKAKKILVYFYHIYLLQFLLGIASGLATYYILQAQEEAKALTTQQEVRAFTRSPRATFDRQALKNHRFTMINSLNFRDEPSMNSNVIDSLPIGTTVRVINKSDRSWLLVEVEINGELEQGWVLRCYTTYFK